MLTVVRFIGLLLIFPVGQNVAVKAPPPPLSGDSKLKSIVACVDSSKSTAELPPPGPACEKSEFAARGEPFMFPENDGLAFGISATPAKPGTLYMWVDNRSDQPKELLLCCNSSLFERIDIFDSDGHRLKTKAEEALEKARRDGTLMQTIEACSCSGWVSVPAHTKQFLMFAEISVAYTLPPGHYTVGGRQGAAKGVNIFLPSR
jgi:hypothetical protein